jgi:hypothetical protein
MVKSSETVQPLTQRNEWAQSVRIFCRKNATNVRDDICKLALPLGASRREPTKVRNYLKNKAIPLNRSGRTRLRESQVCQTADIVMLTLA